MNKYWDGKLDELYGTKYSWQMHDTAFPLAHKAVLDGIKSDGKRIFLETKDGTIDFNGKKQFKPQHF